MSRTVIFSFTVVSFVAWSARSSAGVATADHAFIFELSSGHPAALQLDDVSKASAAASLPESNDTYTHTCTAVEMSEPVNRKSTGSERNVEDILIAGVKRGERRCVRHLHPRLFWADQERCALPPNSPCTAICPLDSQSGAHDYPTRTHDSSPPAQPLRGPCLERPFPLQPGTIGASGRAAVGGRNRARPRA